MRAEDFLDGVTATAAPSADDFLGQPEPSSMLRRGIADPAISLLKGAIAVPEAAVGLANIPTMGLAGKAAEGIGFRPKEARAELDAWYSPEQEAANKRVQDAKGFVPTIQAAVENPSVIGHTVAESIPSMLGGAAVARGILGAGGGALSRAVGATAAPTIAGAAGEGIVGAGLASEQIRQQTPTGTLTPEQLGYIGASGIGTALIGAAGGAAARRMGLSDVDTMLAGGVGTAGTRGMPARVLGGAVSEGVLEEMPQSAQEQVWQNLALNKPVAEGVPEQAAIGLLSGAVMGGAGGIVPQRQAQPPGPLQKAAEASAVTTTPTTTPASGNPAGTIPGNQPTATGIAAAVQNTPAAPGIPPAPVSTAAPSLPTNQAEPAGVPVSQPQEGAVPRGNETEITQPAAPGRQAQPAAVSGAAGTVVDTGTQPANTGTQPANDADSAAAEREWQSFVASEGRDIGPRQLAVIRGQFMARRRMASGIEEETGRVDDARQREVAANRMAILEDLPLTTTGNTIRRFASALRDAGISDYRVSPEERQMIARRVAARDTLQPLEQEPPNELTLPEKQTKSVAPTMPRMDAIRRKMSAPGVRLVGNRLLDRHGKRLDTLSADEIQDLAQKKPQEPAKAVADDELDAFIKEESADLGKRRVTLRALQAIRKQKQSEVDRADLDALIEAERGDLRERLARMQDAQAAARAKKPFVVPPLQTPAQPTTARPLDQTAAEFPAPKVGTRQTATPLPAEQQPPAAPPVPSRISNVIASAVTKLRDISDSLDNVVAARGHGHILATELAAKQGDIDAAKERLAKVRALAAKNGVDVESVIAELGGEPDFTRFAAKPSMSPGNVSDTLPSDILPDGWTEANPGGMATNPDKERGGIVDKNPADGKWFFVSNGDGYDTDSGFDTRADALAALENLSKAVEPAAPADDIKRYKGVPVDKPAAELSDDEVAKIAAPAPEQFEDRNAELALYQGDPRFFVPAHGHVGAVQTDFMLVRNYLRDGSLSERGRQIDDMAAALRVQDISFTRNGAIKSAYAVLTAIESGRYNDILHPDNKQSRKLFESMTGEKLPVGVRATAQFFTRKPFAIVNRPKVGKQASATGRDYGNVRFIVRNPGDGKPVFAEALEDYKDVKIPGLGSRYKFFSHANDNGTVTITEASTGLAFAFGTTDQNAIANAQDLLRKHGASRIVSVIDGSSTIPDSLKDAAVAKLGLNKENLGIPQNIPSDAAAIIAKYDLPSNTSWVLGKALVNGHWSAASGGVSSNYFASADDAAKDLASRLESKRRAADEEDKLRSISQTAAAKIRKGEQPTDAEWKVIFGGDWKEGHRYVRQPVASEFLTQYLGVPKHRIRASIGAAAGTLTSDFGAKYPIVYPRKLVDVFSPAQQTQPDAQAEPTSNAGELPEKAAKTEPLENLEELPADAGVAADDIGAIFDKTMDDVFGEAPARTPKYEQPKQPSAAAKARAEREQSGRPREPRSVPPSPAPKRDPAASAASAAKNAGMGLADVAKGLNALFKPKPGTLGMGLPFDEDTYAAAKPYFQAGIAHFKQAGADIAEMMKSLIVALRDQFGMDRETITAMKPYVVRFMADAKAGKLDYDEASTPKEASDDPADQGSPPPLDQPMAEGQKPDTAIRGAITNRSRPRRSDDRGVRGAGRRADGSLDESGPMGGGRGSEEVSDGTNGAVAGDVRRVSSDFRPGLGALTREGSWFDAAKRNIDLIELAIQIDKEKRNATTEEQAQLAKYVGFGASEIRNALFPIPGEYAKRQEPNRLIWPNLVRDARWKPLAERIDALPRDWQKSILQSTQYAHYTSEGIIRSIWSAIQRLGFTGGNIFEPGTGIGSFSMLMPDGIHETSRFTGVEFDAPTALIARLLSPDQQIQHDDFIKRKFPKNYFDVNVGNPPFQKTKILGDAEYAKHGFMLHDFFFAKGIDLVRPGGLQVFVTSKGTMDKKTDRARKFLSDRADLIGAIRLPSTAFEGNAGTSVVTDVIFLRKRAPGEAPRGVAWGAIKTVDTKDGPVEVNEYFADHPEMILGQQRISGNIDDLGRRVSSNGYGGEKYTVVSYDSTAAELDAKFAEAVERLPENVYSPLLQSDEAVKAETRKVDFDPSIKREGVIYLDKDGAILRVSSGVGVPLDESVKLSDKDRAWLKEYVGIRDLVQTARLAQVADGDWKSTLRALNKAYDAFRAERGPILDFRTQTRKSTDEDGNIVETESRIFKNKRLYREDYDSALMTSLESISESGEIVKAPFLLGRTIGKPVAVEVKSIGDALAVSLDSIGALDLADIGRRMKLDRDETIEALGNQIYKTPAGQWQLSDEYLSGDVVTKLEEAEHLARSNPEYRRNVDALKEVQPEKLGPSQISAKLGAAWIPESHVNEFAKEIGAGPVTFDNKTETWQVDGGNRRSERRAGAEYGTAARSASELLESALNSRSIKVTTVVDKKTVTDVAATTAANEMAKKIKDKFKGWVWADSDRASELVEAYNSRFNNIAPRKFDGSHLTLPGVSLRFKLHPHQLRSIWRQIQTGDTYLAHAVGAGKTIEMIAGAMEQKRLGLIKKPMFVVPNHMLEQFSNEFMELYPLANIMVADDENFSAERRKAFVASATLNSPDAIIITHSAFKRIGVTEASVAPIRDEIVTDLELELSSLAKDQGTRVRRSQLEQQIEAVNQRFDAIIGASGKDSTIKFEDIGADFIYADEAHAFRKLDFHTAQQIKGIDPNGSQAAMDMYVKTRILERARPGRAFVFASGTPVTNTMGELFTIMRFFAQKELDLAGISTFDSWARQFGEVAPALEPNAAGKYELIERFAKFDNVPELMSRVRQFMDVLTSESLGALVKRPDLAGGKPNLVVVEPTKALEAYMKGELSRRIEASKAWKPSPQEPNNPDPIVSIITDGRFAAIDPRFFGAELEGESIITTMASNVVAKYHATNGNVYHDKDGNPAPIKGSTQVVFYNLGFGEQSQRSRGFNSRAAFTKLLTDGGIPRNEIAWFDDANTDAKKEAIFKDMRSGKLKVLIGSAKKMGTGVNVQNRLIALHYQDPPWFPADVEQPHGRIIRQGNLNQEVSIDWYTTKGTYQSTMWQMVGRKQRFIDQAFTGDKSLRSMDDMGEASLFEQAAAVASGDPRALQLAGLRQDVERLERLQAAHASEQINVRAALRQAEWEADYATTRIKQLSLAFKAIGERYFQFESGVVAGRTYNKPGEFGQALKDAFNQATKDRLMDMAGGESIRIASIGDAIKITMEAQVDKNKPTGAFFLNVEFGGFSFHIITSPSLGTETDAVGLARKVFNRINDVESGLRTARSDLANNESDIIRLRKKRGAPFEYQQEMAEKYGELKRLEAELQGEGEKAAVPSSAGKKREQEQADQIQRAALSGALPGERQLARYDMQDNMARDSGAMPGESRFSKASGIDALPPADRAVYSMAAEGKSTDEILSFISKASRRPFNRVLAAAMRRAGLSSTVTLDSASRFGKQQGAQRYAAAYNSRTDTVALFTPREAERHILHELVHAATMKAIQANGLSAVRLRALFKHVQQSGMADGQYGMSNLDEFVAEAFSNPRFQEALRGLPAPAGSTLKSAWQWFVRIVARIVGIKTRPSETALDRALTVGAQLMQENAVLAGRRGGGGARFSIAEEDVRTMSSGLSEGRIDRMFMNYAYTMNDSKTKAYLAWVSPDDFIKAATPESGIQRLETEKSPLDLEMLRAETQDIQLIGEQRGNAWITTGHEGRHRMMALRDAGVTKVPVVFYAYSGQERSPISRIVVMPQKHGGQASASGFVARNLTPINYENEAMIRSEFGRHSDIRFNIATDWQQSPVAQEVAKAFKAAARSDEKLSWLNPVQTQYHKAERLAQQGKFGFKRVFDLGQKFLSDISRFAVMAENSAPTLFHQIRSAADVKQAVGAAMRGDFGKQHNADIKAIASPLYEGTLYGGGNPMAGMIWTDEQLRNRFGLTDRQIKLYHEARDAVQVSMDEMAKSLIAKHAKRERVTVDPSGSLQDVAETVRDSLNLRADVLAEEAQSEHDDTMQQVEDLRAAGGQDRRANDMESEAKAKLESQQAEVARIQATVADVQAIADKAQKLQDAGYFPLMRFGRHTVTAKDENGKVQHFSMHDGIPLVPRSGQAQANRLADALRDEHPDWDVQTGLMNPEKYKLYQGMSVDALQLFADHLDADTKQTYQEILRLATNERSALKRMLKREGTPGFDRDVRRTLASFILSNARYTSSAYNMADMAKAAEDANEDGGDIGAEAVKLYEYVAKPQEEAAKIRGFLFFNFLGGSLAAAMVNATQVPMMTFPRLAQYEQAGKLAARLGRAAKLAVRNPADIQGDIGAAMRRAEENGITAPHQIYEMTATAANNVFTGSRAGSAVLRAWGAPFALAESFNRRTTFIAAYQIGQGMTANQLRDAGAASAFEFAEKMVQETQGIYNRGNRVNIGRGAIGATVMTFKQFSIMYLEMFGRLPARQKAIMAGMLILAAGAGGLPFAEDIEDIIDTIGQWLGYRTNTRRTIRRGLSDLAGQRAADIAMNGVLSQIGVDLHSRLGLQNIIPGSALMKPSTTDKSREFQDLLGPAASVVAATGQALQDLATGRPDKAALAMAPVAVQNAVKGAKMAATGRASDMRGKPTIPVSAAESAAKGIGFNPKAVADYGTAKRDIMQDERLLDVTRERFTAAIVDAIIAGDDGARREALQQVVEWNRRNPDARININPAAIRRRVADMRAEGPARVLKSLSPSLRQQARQEFADAQ